METGGKTYSIDPRRRYSQLRLHTLFASPTVVIAMLICLGVVVITVLAVLTEQVPDTIGMSIMIISASLLGLFAWLFAYATTSHVGKNGSSSLQDMMQGKAVNVADAAGDSLVRLLGAHYKTGAAQEVAPFIDALLGDALVESALARLELTSEAVAGALHGAYVDLSWEVLAGKIAIYAAGTDRSHIAPIDVLAALLVQKEMQPFLRKHDVRSEDVRFVVWWQHAKIDARAANRRWWDANTMLNFSGIGLSWAAGYTPFVDQFSRIPRGSAWDIGAFHREQVESLITSLARRQQSNVLLVGQPGVGRMGVVKELMYRVRKNVAHPSLNGQRVLYIHVSQLVSLGKDSAAQLSFISRALDEMEQAGNVIAVLDGLGSILGQNESKLNLTDVLVPFFSSSSVRVVVVMSLDDYHQHVAGNDELEHLFEIIEVPSASQQETLQMLALSVESQEQENEIFVPYRALREITESTVSILPHIPFPEKAFDVLEELIVEARGGGQKGIKVEDVHRLITRKTGVGFGAMKAGESEKLLSLADAIHRRVVNQQQGVEAVSRAMVRARAGVRSHNRPIGSFLFLGPTGVGKTETAKALADAYFGSDAYVQRLDMSEFQGQDAADRLIGTANNPMGRLPALVADHPFSVILLDEFEKASQAAQQLFLPLFDEGYITDAHGRRYSFVHTIIIATSNAGSEFIRKAVTDDGKLPDGFDAQLREHILQEHIFLPELLNRFDGVITFTPLTQAHIKEIARLMLIDLNKRLDAKQGVVVQITEELINFLATAGYDPQFGARPMRRLIQDEVEYWAAKQIVAGSAAPGQQITVPIRQKTA